MSTIQYRITPSVAAATGLRSLVSFEEALVLHQATRRFFGLLLVVKCMAFCGFLRR